MARPLPVKRAARPLPGPTEHAIREQARREALDEADRQMHATLGLIRDHVIVLGQRMDTMAAHLAEVVAWVRAQQQAGNGHAVDPLARTVSAVNGDSR